MAAAKNFISEDDIEQALLQRLQHLCGFDALNCFTAQPDDLNDGSGRTDKREVILADRLRAALERLNPQTPAHAVDQALAQLVQPRTAMSLVAANREMDGLIRDGVPVTYKPETGPQAGQTVTERLKVIAFDEPDPRTGRNHYLAVSQLWVRGEHGYRRPDVLLYVNGLPLVFTSTENYYDELTAYAQELREEAERHIREGLTEDELELFDLLKKESLTQDETQRVKLAAKHLLKRLVEEQSKVLVQNWHQSAQTQKQVRAEIERVLDADLPESYDRTTFKQKCDNVYDLAVEYALRGRRWAA